jgi:probable HAF family extracellular repeat protein
MKMQMMRTLWSTPSAGRVLVAIAASSLLASQAGALSFTPLGDLPLGDFNSTAYAISNDGTTVVGTGNSAVDSEAFRWTLDTGMLPLADLPGGGGESTAYGVSSDGSLIAGYGSVATGSGTSAASWSSPLYAPSDLGSLGDPNPYSRANGVSGDGSVIVGDTTVPSGFIQGFLWTSGGGMVSLGDLPGGPASSSAAAVSDNGLVIVGGSGVSGPTSEAFRWESNVMTGLGDLAGGIVLSNAYGVSGDGTTVVGDSISGNGLEAFIWTLAAGSMTGLGDLAGGTFDSHANDTNSDGSLIVGYGTAADDTKHATIWNSSGQIFDLNVIAAAVLPAGWILEEAFGISADGLSIVGRGNNPDGNNEAWLLQIDFAPVPEPGTGLLIALGLLALAAARRR